MLRRMFHIMIRYTDLLKRLVAAPCIYTATGSLRISSSGSCNLKYFWRYSHIVRTDVGIARQVDDQKAHQSSHGTSHLVGLWSHLNQNLRHGGYFDNCSGREVEVSIFSWNSHLPEDFIRAAHACLVFCRTRPDLLRLLPRDDIQVIVENGSPFLFKDAFESKTRLQSFLSCNNTKVLESEIGAADVMCFLLSYIYSSVVAPEWSNWSNTELVEVAACRLLDQFLALSRGRQPGTMESTEKQFPVGKNIEMKKGDWICARCNFMNFARNMKCLECKEDRPGALASIKWECPQCKIFNYGRNSVCTNCNYERHVFGDHPFWSSAQANRSRSMESENKYSITDQSLGTNEFVSSRKTSFERKLADEQYKKALRNEYLEDGMGDCKSSGLQDSLNQTLDRILARISSDEKGCRESNPRLTGGLIEARRMIHQQDRSKVQDVSSCEEMSSLPGEKSTSTNGCLTPGHVSHEVQHHQESSVGWGACISRSCNYAGDTIFGGSMEKISYPDSGGIGNENQHIDKSHGEEIARTSSRRPELQVDNQQCYSGNRNTGHLLSNPAGKPMHQHAGLPSREIQGPARLPGESNWDPGVLNKSLEGSAVKEIDPLDMSEEAKAERWFRRVAQIKDISELSQIPDEDFPSIMPMRKGVNRFVVSKRKTPLERRLTSQQYRKNLQTVNCDPDGASILAKNKS